MASILLDARQRGNGYIGCRQCAVVERSQKVCWDLRNCNGVRRRRSWQQVEEAMIRSAQLSNCHPYDKRMYLLIKCIIIFFALNVSLFKNLQPEGRSPLPFKYMLFKSSFILFPRLNMGLHFVAFLRWAADHLFIVIYYTCVLQNCDRTWLITVIYPACVIKW